MKALNASLLRGWQRLGTRFLPFADVATPDLPLGRLVRLSLFQVSVGMSAVLLIGTLNRVMIVELGVPTSLVGLMVALPIVFAPFRALIGFRSDTHRSALGWRRVPYIWFGSLLQFGGLAIMPFALLLLSGDTEWPPIFGQLAAALAFLLVGAGLHTVQTVGLALATDLAAEETQPRVVALMSVVLLAGMVVSALIFGALLADFSQLRLIQVIQGAAVVTMALNCIALWKQEPRDPARTARHVPQPSFSESWAQLREGGQWNRRLLAVGLGSAAFSMQDVLLEPYGGQVLGMSVAGTTMLTALFAAGGIAGFALSARALSRPVDPHRLAAYGALIGAFAFAAIILAAPTGSVALFFAGTAMIGLGSGFFVAGTLTACIRFARKGQTGLALGAWGAVQATAVGAAIAMGSVLRDVIGGAATAGTLGSTLQTTVTGYGAVYLIEIVLLFLTLAVIGPLVRHAGAPQQPAPQLDPRTARAVEPTPSLAR
ncbi:BCD family MFS transporter [Elioraea rosea]|uniref:BCD family MFS transporter n=1 Tax=Elioraea rosea TaxID=2492390 RepID=UPI0011839D68|nr:BCD family MFS transporter [Elioraea rosea]